VRENDDKTTKNSCFAAAKVPLDLDSGTQRQRAPVGRSQEVGEREEELVKCPDSRRGGGAGFSCDGNRRLHASIDDLGAPVVANRRYQHTRARRTPQRVKEGLKKALPPFSLFELDDEISETSVSRYTDGGKCQSVASPYSAKAAGRKASKCLSFSRETGDLACWPDSTASRRVLRASRSAHHAECGKAKMKEKVEGRGGRNEKERKKRIDGPFFLTSLPAATAETYSARALRVHKEGQRV
jgi:hypothetical protein